MFLQLNTKPEFCYTCKRVKLIPLYFIMEFKAYDILSSLLPGYLLLWVVLKVFGVSFDNNLIIVYTAFAFLLGYIINTLSSWLEDFYYYTWNGKPSSNLLNGKGIWKVKFYHYAKAKLLLIADAQNPTATNDELFSIAMRHANGEKDSRVDDFNAIYSFSRALLTSSVIGTITLLIENYNDWRYYIILLPTTFILWLRCKQRGYYYAKEVLNVYLKIKEQ